MSAIYFNLPLSIEGGGVRFNEFIFSPADAPTRKQRAGSRRTLCEQRSAREGCQLPRAKSKVTELGPNLGYTNKVLKGQYSYVACYESQRSFTPNHLLGPMSKRYPINSLYQLFLK